MANAMFTDMRVSDGTTLSPLRRASRVADSRGLDQQVLDHLDLLYRVAFSLTRDAEDARALTQEAVVRALRHPRPLGEGVYVKAWLLQILRDTFIRSPLSAELAGIEAFAEGRREERAEEPAAPREGNATWLLGLLNDRTRRAVESLPGEFRRAVIMAEVEDRSYKEIGEAMNCPPSTVAWRLFHGRKLLQERL